MIPKKGDRVRMTGIMPEDPSPMEVGAEGTVSEINKSYYPDQAAQIYVDWDNGRSLILLSSDPFMVIGGKSDS